MGSTCTRMRGRSDLLSVVRTASDRGVVLLSVCKYAGLTEWCAVVVTINTGVLQGCKHAVNGPHQTKIGSMLASAISFRPGKSPLRYVYGTGVGARFRIRKFIGWLRTLVTWQYFQFIQINKSQISNTSIPCTTPALTDISMIRCMYIVHAETFWRCHPSQTKRSLFGMRSSGNKLHPPTHTSMLVPNHFLVGGANLQHQEKGVIFQAWVGEILKKGNNFACICLFEHPVYSRFHKKVLYLI